MRKSIIDTDWKTLGAEKKSSDLRLTKAGKNEFTDVIEYFSVKHNVEDGFFLQAQNKKGYQSQKCIRRMISRWAKNTLKTVLNLTDINKTANALHYHRYVNKPSNSSLNPTLPKLGYLEVKSKW